MLDFGLDLKATIDLMQCMDIAEKVSEYVSISETQELDESSIGGYKDYSDSKSSISLDPTKEKENACSPGET